MMYLVIAIVVYVMTRKSVRRYAKALVRTWVRDFGLGVCRHGFIRCTCQSCGKSKGRHAAQGRTQAKAQARTQAYDYPVWTPTYRTS